MKRVTILFLTFYAISATAQQPEPTAAQCRGSYGMILSLSKHNLELMRKSMTAGDELVLSTQVERCLSRYPDQWTPAQQSVLNGFVYDLDADVVARMFNFLDRHGMAEKFNDEEVERRERNKRDR